MSETATKRCTTCGRDLPMTEYHANGRGGLRAECRSCAKAKAKAKGREGAREAEARYRERNRGKLRARQRAWRKANPDRWRAINTRAVKRWRKANPDASRERNRLAYERRRARQRQEADT